MNQSKSTLADPEKGNASIAHSLFLGSGIYALACAPAIFLAEWLGWSQSFFHVTQLIATILCLFSAACFLWNTQGKCFNWSRCFAFGACVLSSLWLAFVLNVFLTLDFSAID